MLKREEHIKSISDKLAILQKTIEFRGILSLHDINIFAESFVADLLNIKNEWSLKNLNTNYGIFPAVDLGDSTNRVAVQVTSTKTNEKINHTLELAEKNGLVSSFDSIIVFIISKKQNKYSSIKVPNGMKFNWKTDIWDWDDIVKSLHHLPTIRLSQLSDFIDMEISNYSDKSKFSDEATIKTFRQFLNSGMLKDDFNVESDVSKFKETLEKHIEMINVGKRENKVVSKSYYELENPNWRKVFEIAHERFLSLRSLYISCVKKGEIDLNSGNNYFNGSKRVAKIFNDLVYVLKSKRGFLKN